MSEEVAPAVVNSVPPQQPPEMPPPVDTPSEMEIDPESKIPGTRLSYKDAKALGIPVNMIEAIPTIAQKVHPRRLGIVETDGEYFLYRSVSRREFKTIVKDAADRSIKMAEAAQEGGQGMTQASLNAEVQTHLEEKIAATACVFPRLEMAQMGDYDAGLPKLLHDAIMDRSSFQQNVVPIIL